MTFALLAIAAGLTTAHAAGADNVRLVRIDNGPNTLKIRGQEALVFRAWRENFNAHGFGVITFYLRSKTDGTPARWALIPFLSHGKDGDKDHLELTTSGGADCQLHDFRLLMTPDGREVSVIVADRDMGESYVDTQTVHFDYYTLAENAEGIPGWPPFYFKAVKTVDAKAKYCDVNEAFDKELHLGTSSGVTGNGVD